MVKKKSEQSVASSETKPKKRVYKKKTEKIPFLPVTEEGQELTPIKMKDFPDTVGGILQQARMQKRMKLPSIAKKLRIREEFLDALEKGNYYVFPALVYGVGFLRTYANFLGLNADELITRFKKETTDIQSTPLDMPRTHDPKVMPTPKIIFKSLAVLIVLYLIWTIFRIVTYTPFPEPQISEVAQIKEETLAAPVISDEVPPSATETILEETAPIELVEPTPTEEKKGTIYGWAEPYRISIVATDKTHVKVTDTTNNKIILNQFLKEGDRYNPQKRSENFILATTDAGALDLYIDGKMIRTLGEKGKEISDIQLNADVLMEE